MKVYWKIELYSKDTDTDYSWSSTATDLTALFNPHKLMVREGLGDTKDTFSFSVTNFGDALDNYFNVGDKVRIYRKVDSSSITSTDVLMNGLIIDLPYDEDSSKNIQAVKGSNYTELLLNAITFVDGRLLDIPTFLENCINGVNAYNVGFQVTWSDTNPSTASNGGSFPLIGERWYNRSILKAFEKFSADTFTTDGNYYYYLDANNVMFWRRREDNPVETFDTEIDEFRSIKIRKDTKGVVNFVIARASFTSPGGDIMSVRIDDAVSRAKHGFKYYSITGEALASVNYVKEDKSAGIIDEDSQFPSSYPATTSWKATETISSTAGNNVPSMTAGSTIVVANDKEYDRAVFYQTKARMKQIAKAYIDEHRNGKLQTEVEFAPGKASASGAPWGLGDVINVTIPQINKVNNPMRVKERTFTDNSEFYVLEEDEGTV